MLDLNELFVTQSYVRDLSQIEGMIKHVKNNGFFNNESILNYNPKSSGKLMHIALFPDSSYYIHDGHHRSVAIYLGGRKYLRKDEYELQIWSYEQYTEINFLENWVTPFDPRIEVRLPDFWNFKNKVMDLYKINPNDAHKYIVKNKQQFAIKKKYSKLPGLANIIYEQLVH